MFRPMRRHGQQLSEQECIELLTVQRRGVLALSGEDGYPYAVPMNFLYREGKIYFHGASQGHKIDALKKDPRVSFCVYDEGEYREGHWAPWVKSVIVFGEIGFAEDPELVVSAARALGRKHTDDEAYIEDEIARGKDRVQLLELTIRHMTGKVVHEC